MYFIIVHSISFVHRCQNWGTLLVTFHPRCHPRPSTLGVNVSTSQQLTTVVIITIMRPKTGNIKHENNSSHTKSVKSFLFVNFEHPLTFLKSSRTKITRQSFCLPLNYASNFFSSPQIQQLTFCSWTKATFHCRLTTLTYHSIQRQKT